MVTFYTSTCTSNCLNCLQLGKFKVGWVVGKFGDVRVGDVGVVGDVMVAVGDVGVAVGDVGVVGEVAGPVVGLCWVVGMFLFLWV